MKLRIRIIVSLALATLLYAGLALAISIDGPRTQEWLPTFAAKESGLQCDPDEVCMELCIVSDNQEYGLGIFDCKPR